jgi:photosystem II stability/assembly factor-like uncharacterized protein
MMRTILSRLALLLPLLLIGGAPETEAATAPASATWHWINPVPQGNNLQGVTCAVRFTCYAVGNFGTILVTHDNGATWDPLASGTTRALSTIACPSPTVCYTVGPYGTILSTHDAGRTWALHQQRGAYQLDRISCPDRRICYALGNDANYQCHVPGCAMHGQNIVLLVTRDGGAHWRRINAGKTGTLIDIACPGRNRCITIGDGGTILLMTNGGRTWARRGSLATNVYLQAIACAGTRACYAVGFTVPRHGRNSGVFLTTADSGRTWHESTAIPPRTGVAEYGGIACPAAGTCYVRGFHGTVLITHDSGRHWRSLTVDTPDQPAGIACAGIQVCHVLGASSVILSTTNGGQTWHEYPRGTKESLAAVTCPTVRKCRALAPSGLLLVTGNGGQTWTSRSSPLRSNQGFPLPGLTCPTAATCYVTGQKGTVYKTTDAGKTWQTLATPFTGTSLPLAGVACPSASVCYATGSGCLIANCYGPDSRVVVFGTRNGGHAWHVLYDKRSRDLIKARDAILEAIACPSVQTCYVTGSPGLVITTRDGGRTWDDRHSPASSSNLELSGIACPGDMVCYTVGTGCRGGASGCLIGDFIGVVLTTRNGGRTWQRYESTRTVLTTGSLCGSSGVCPAGVTLDAIACASLRACRVVGEYGMILTTTDAGKTWRRETTPTDNSLFGIACPTVGACLAVGDGGAILGIGSAGLSLSVAPSLRERFHREQRPGSGRVLYEQAMTRLLHQKRFGLKEPGT